MTKTTERQGFKIGEFIVYPAHGVGQIVSIDEQAIAGAKLELFVINFVKDKMILRVPTNKIASAGMRKLAEGPLITRALETLQGRARNKSIQWARRAQEHTAKINSGDIISIAEVVRDLCRSASQPEQSYSDSSAHSDIPNMPGNLCPQFPCLTTGVHSRPLSLVSNLHDLVFALRLHINSNATALACCSACTSLASSVPSASRNIPLGVCKLK